jgi:hypothetical protein
MHGFDEFFGNLYHLNAEEEPENRDYPGDLKLANGKTFREQFGPRGVLKCKADGNGGQTIEDTGPLDQEADGDRRRGNPRRRQGLHQTPAQGRQAVLLLVERHAHALSHARQGEHTGLAGPSGDEYHDGMVEHDIHVGELLKLLDDLGLAESTIVMYSTDNGPHYNTWPDAGTTPFRSEKNSNWEGAYRVPCFVRWPGKFPPEKPSTASSPTKTGCPPLLPRPATDIVEQLKAGRQAGRPKLQELHRRPQHAGLPQRQVEGITAPARNSSTWTTVGRRRHPRRRLEGGLSREPRSPIADLARAVRQSLRCTLILQSASRPV